MCVHVHSCACGLRSLPGSRHNLGELTTILTHGIFLCVGVMYIYVAPLRPDSNHASWLSKVQLIAPVCAHARTHSSVVMLCWLCFASVSPAGSVTMCVNVRLRYLLFCLCDIGVKTRLPVLFVLVESSRISCFVIFGVKIQ